jgi:SSS family solute:Na+ symporter
VLHASALVVAHALDWPVDVAIVALGVFALGYTGLGGIVADIWSDVVQFIVLWGGILVGAGVVLARHGSAALAAVPPDRVRALVLDGHAAVASPFGLWPMLVGGLFLYVSYYACDQTQAQRLLTARSDAAAGRALLLNGLLRFPLVASYCGFGLLLAGLLVRDSAFAAVMDGRPLDDLVPVFMMAELPGGLRGLFLAGILAAAMSSVDSALDSLAAVTLEDVAGRDAATIRVGIGRLVSVSWGAFAVGSGLLFARAGGGVLELINPVGSAFYGPILAVFVLGVTAPRITGPGVPAGLAAGLTVNAALGALVAGLPWLWWNLAGFLVACATALAAGRARPRWPAVPAGAGTDAVLLGAAFAAMLAVLIALPWMLGA